MAKRKAVLIRIPEDLWDHLNRWARDELRSANAQIEYVLREAVRKRAGGRTGEAGGLGEGSGAGNRAST
ncbi:MAG: Arc family DNA binding domain-containing protein [Verrucomicrobiae bacterium]|nr:Arc family DNA binding domain-containing protein [Verrucomicrobiae bacterium]